ncbi:MAG: hypothetical protein JWP55_1463 [Mycobacterium sp.]|jgi:hypothetical protein|nr:hypothetical protein [Mycobacterium sp.]
MITDALTETVIAEAVIENAEAIVRAEWMRLRHDTAPREQARRDACCEMPAARTCVVTVATSTAILEPSRLSPPRRRVGWPHRGGPQRRVFPTQRSPPRRSPSSIEQGEVMP